MAMVKHARGEVWLANLDPTIGSEIQKTRPCVLISPPEMERLKTVIVAPLTSGSHPAPFRIEVQFDGKDGRILLDQIRTLDKVRLVKKLGSVEQQTLSAVLETLREMFAP